jgi:hypothetical protein
VAFSLGCQVAKSCLNRLHKLHKLKIVQNVYLLAGATSIGKFKKLAQVVSGRMVNVYCTKDTSLSTYNYILKEQAIGRQALMVQHKYNASSSEPGKKQFQLDNYDVSMFVEGHLEYQSKQDLVL